MAPTHFSLAIIWRVIHDQVEFLVVDYSSLDPHTGVRTKKEVKFPGGTNKEYPTETPCETMFREVLQEAGLRVEKSKKIWKSVVSDNHTKYGFLINLDDCRGGLRREQVVDNGDELSPPYWVSAKTLGRVLYVTHQEPFLEAARQLGVF